MSNSVQHHRWQPTRFLRPWDSPGKNTGVGCHFLLQCMKVKSESEVAQLCLTSWPDGLQPTRLLHPWDFPGKSTAVGCQWPSWQLSVNQKWLGKNVNISSFLQRSFFGTPTTMKKQVNWFPYSLHIYDLKNTQWGQQRAYTSEFPAKNVITHFNK